MFQTDNIPLDFNKGKLEFVSPDQPFTALGVNGAF